MFKYNMRLDSFTGSPSVLSTGEGFVNFAVTTVPEPSSAAFLFISTCVLFRRRGRIR